jgi:hypothetical protein
MVVPHDGFADARRRMRIFFRVFRVFRGLFSSQSDVLIPRTLQPAIRNLAHSRLSKRFSSMSRRFSYLTGKYSSWSKRYSSWSKGYSCMSKRFSCLSKSYSSLSRRSSILSNPFSCGSTQITRETQKKYFYSCIFSCIFFSGLILFFFNFFILKKVEAKYGGVI